MNDDFAPFELAVKLNEKGFDEPCYGYYHCNGGNDSFELCGNGDRDFQNSKNRYRVAAPTIPQVLKWLREEQGYNVNMRIYSPDGWYWTIQDRDGNYCCSYLTLSDDLFETYEQAALAGIEYVLDNLI